MSSRKKRKRKMEREHAERLNRLNGAASASAIGNPNPVDTSSTDNNKKDPPKPKIDIEVDEKPESKKEEKPKVQKKENKPDKADKPKTADPKSQKQIIGFGSKEKSTTVHAISNMNNSALCDKRIENIEINKDLTALDCNCSSCKKYSIFKQLLTTTTGHEPAEKAAATEKKENKPKTLTKEKIKEVKKEIEEDEFGLETEMTIFENKIKSLMKRMEKRVLEKLTDKLEELVEGRPEFFIIQSGENSWGIVHDKSRLVIVNGLTIEQAEKLLPLYMDIPYKWDGKSKMPQEWMTSIRTIFTEAKLKAKENKEEPKTRKIKRRTKDEPKRVLKRRKKDEPRKIRRRSRHN